MPATQASNKIPFVGADDPAEEVIAEPSEAELRLAELEAENRDLRHQLRCLQSAMVGAAGLLQPYVTRLNGK